MRLWCRWQGSVYRAHRAPEPFWCKLRVRPYSTLMYYAEPAHMHQNPCADARMFRARERTRPMKLKMALKRMMYKMRDDGMRAFYHEGTTDWFPVDDGSRYVDPMRREVAFQRGIAVRGEFWPWQMRMLRRQGFRRWLRFLWHEFRPMVVREEP